MFHVFHFSNVISEMTIKRQSPAQRGVRISGRISLQLDEDGQRIRRERSLAQSMDSRRYFCCVHFQCKEQLLVDNILNLLVHINIAVLQLKAIT